MLGRQCDLKKKKSCFFLIDFFTEYRTLTFYRLPFCMYVCAMPIQRLSTCYFGERNFAVNSPDGEMREERREAIVVSVVGVVKRIHMIII